MSRDVCGICMCPYDDDGSCGCKNSSLAWTLLQENKKLQEVNQELLEALQEIVAAADGDGWNQLDASFKKARAAIAKATGETK